MRTSVFRTMAVVGGAGALTAGLLAQPSAAFAGEEPPNDTSAPCEDVDGGDLVEAATADLPLPEGFEDEEWANVEADMDACAQLSYAVVTIEGGTGSSPYQIMLFNGTKYVGTATEKAYAFAPEIERVDDDTIDVEYSYLEDGDANASPSGTAEASFSWDWETDELLFSGELPPE